VVHHPTDIFESLEPGSERRRKMMLEVIGEQMIDSIDFVLILENPRELSDGFLVVLTTHEWSS
jgi:hypothetical protein